jgi:hypothetical protein
MSGVGILPRDCFSRYVVFGCYACGVAVVWAVCILQLVRLCNALVFVLNLFPFVFCCFMVWLALGPVFSLLVLGFRI